MKVGDQINAKLNIPVKKIWRGGYVKVLYQCTILKIFKNGNVVVCNNEPIGNKKWLENWPVKREDLRQSNHEITEMARKHLENYLK